jgi:hypothetical protein
MRSAFISVAALLATSAQAQVADSLSRRIPPNAIDRSLSQTPPTSLNGQVEADRERPQQAAREAAARRVPPPTSTLVDGPTGVQRSGSGFSPPSPTTAPPPPPLPQD